MRSEDDLETIETELLLEGIYRYYGFDFRNYVSASIKRRIRYRIQLEHLTSISSLQEKVLHEPDVMVRLLSDFSIHVSEMFRDPLFFRSFREKVVPVLRDFPFLRIWHAGCAAGEEVYSMAITLLEEGLYHKTRIYATDMNEDLLKTAREGEYSLEKIQGYADNYHHAGGTKELNDYYQVRDNQAIFNSALKQNVLFAQHNLVTDHTFNEFNVIICRNVMIYFNKTLQNRVHELFYASLSPLGVLGLGEKEDLAFSNFAQYYEGLDLEQKIYRKVK